MYMYMHVFLNNWEYPTEYIQHLWCNDTLRIYFLHNNIVSIIEKEVALKWENKMMLEIER